MKRIQRDSWTSTCDVLCLYRRVACYLAVLCGLIGGQVRQLVAQGTNGATRARPSATQAFAFTRLSVIDVESGAVVSDVTVVISGNRIVSVGRDARIPKGARAIDARGKVLILGLSDMHSHSLDRWEWSSLLNVANGVTGIRDPAAVRNAQEIVQLRRSVESGDTLGPRFVASGTIIDGSPKSRATYVAIDSAPAMRAEIRSRQQADLDFIKAYRRLSSDVFLAGADEARRLDLPLVGHVPLAITAAEASDAGMRSVRR